jgi:hypothetical protein
VLKCNDISILSDGHGAIFVDIDCGEWYGANPVASLKSLYMPVAQSIGDLCDR